MKLFAAATGAQRKNVRGASALAYGLLEYAVWREMGIKCPAVSKTAGGKPYFPDAPDIFFSVSHTGSHVLVGLSDSELGVDIETVREMASGLTERLFSDQMRRSFSFFEGWTLRESVFKLTGEGSLRNMEFAEKNGEILAPFEGVRCRLYNNVPGCAAAAACRAGAFPDTIEIFERDLFYLEK